MTALAFRLQTSYNTILEAVQAEDSGIEDNDDREEKAFAIEFTLGELLRLAVHLDYSDEIGRRKMFGVISKHLFVWHNYSGPHLCPRKYACPSGTPGIID